MKDKNIDKLFREKLLEYEKQPPAYLLENVLAGVAGAKRKRKIAFWRVAGVAAALLLAFIAGWQFNYMNHENVKQPVVVNQKSSEPNSKGMNAAPENGTIQKQKQEAESSGRHQVQRLATVENTSPSETSDKTGSEKQKQLSSRASQQGKNTFSETIAIARTDESGRLHPIKTITRLIGHNDQFVNILQEKKVNSSVIEQQELTIDRQIIEQNQQQLQAQAETQRKRHWLVGAQVSPAYNVNRSSHSSEYASNMLNSNSNTPVELGGGLSIEYKPGKRWSLQSGVYYAGLGQSSGNATNANRNLDAMAAKGSDYLNAPVNIEANKMMINSKAGVIELNEIPSGVELGTNFEDKALASTVVVSDARFIQNFQYIEIPLYLRYSVINARFNVELMGGFSSNVLVGNDTYMESSTGKSRVGKTQDMQGMNYSGTFGLGLKYGLSRRIFLNVEPRVKYYLNSLNSNSAVTYQPYTIGVYTGISYQF